MAHLHYQGRWIIIKSSCQNNIVFSLWSESQHLIQQDQAFISYYWVLKLSIQMMQILSMSFTPMLECSVLLSTQEQLIFGRITDVDHNLDVWFLVIQVHAPLVSIFSFAFIFIDFETLTNCLFQLDAVMVDRQTFGRKAQRIQAKYSLLRKMNLIEESSLKWESIVVTSK